MQPQPPGPDRASVPAEARILLIGILVLAAALRLIDLGESAWLDEVSSISFSTGTPLEVLERLEPQHMPVFFWINSLFLWFGDSEAWLRLPSVLFGMGVVYLLFKIGLEIGNIRLGLTAAALGAVSGFLVHYSQEIRMYGLVVFLAMAGTWATLRILGTAKSGRWPWTVLLGVSLLNLYTSPFAAFMVASHWGLLVVRAVPRTELRRPIAILAGIMALAYIPGLLHMRDMLGGSAEVVAFETRDYDSVMRLVEMSFQHFGGLVPALQVLLAAGSVGGLVLLWRQQRPLANLTLLSLFTPIVALFLAKPGHFFNPRYLIYAQPHLLLLFAASLLWLWDRSAGRLSMPRIVQLGGPAVLAMAVILLPAAWASDSEQIGRKGDWHVLADGILTDLRDGDEIFIEPWWDDMALLYQLDQRSPEGQRIQLSDRSSHSWYRMFRHDWLKRRHPELFRGPEVTVLGLKDRTPLAQPRQGSGRIWLISIGRAPPGFRRLREMPPVHSYSGGRRTSMPTLFFRQ